jgi:hypothetical protein
VILPAAELAAICVTIGVVQNTFAETRVVHERTLVTTYRSSAASTTRMVVMTILGDAVLHTHAPGTVP